MKHQDVYLGNAAAPATEEERQSLVHLRILMHQLSTGLPKLPPQYDSLMGNALLNLGLMRLVVAHGQEATANLLAGAAELLWNNGWQELGSRHN